MSDYISRDAVLNSRLVIEVYDANEDIVDWGVSFDVIKAIPAADVAPVVHGEWRHIGGDEWRCTNCGNVIHTEGSWERPEQKYCEECGARMDDEKPEMRRIK